MAGGEPDDFAQKLFIDLAEDFRREDGEFIRAVGVVEPPDDVFERLVVDRESWRKVVGRFGTAFFGLKMKEAGVVAIVGLLINIAEAAIDILPVKQRL